MGQTRINSQDIGDTEIKTNDIADDAITADKLGIIGTKGDLIVYSTQPDVLVTGVSGRVLVSDPDSAYGLTYTSTPVISTIISATKNNLLAFATAGSSAVNYLRIANANTSGNPTIQALGGDTDINIRLLPKGAGTVKVGSFNYDLIDSDTSQTLNSKTIGNSVINTSAINSSTLDTPTINNGIVNTSIINSSTLVDPYLQGISFNSVEYNNVTGFSITTGTVSYLISGDNAPTTGILPEDGGYNFTIINNRSTGQSGFVVISGGSTGLIDRSPTLRIREGQKVLIYHDGLSFNVLNDINTHIHSYYRISPPTTNNRWYVTAANATAMTTAVSTQNQIKFMPLIIARPSTIDMMAVLVTTTGVGSNIYMGIYNDNGNLYPNELIVSGAVVAGTIATLRSGVIPNPINLNPGLYWTATCASGLSAPTLRAVPLAACYPILGVNQVLGTAPGLGWTITGNATGLPPRIGPNATVATAVQPCVYVRYV